MPLSVLLARSGGYVQGSGPKAVGHFPCGLWFRTPGCLEVFLSAVCSIFIEASTTDILMEAFFTPPILFGLLVGITLLLSIFLIDAYHDKQYKKSAYYQVTGNSYSSVKSNSGQYGEYLVYKDLSHLEENGSKFLFNVYIPKSDSQTSEIDVLLICSRGLFVFESKNFSGWIFGNQAHKNWTQTLPYGWRGDCLKVRFYNPIMQNASHIRYLKRLLNERVPIHSVIVFSNSCTLKSITVTGDDVSVINRDALPSIVNQIWNKSPTDLLTQTDIGNIYNTLYPYTQVSHEERAQHENDVRLYLRDSDYKKPPNDTLRRSA